MRLLLDTHVAIWAVTDSVRLNAKARELIEDSGTQSFVSVASIWEIAIKHGQAKRPNAPPFSAAEATRYFEEAAFTVLPINANHAVAVQSLPRLHSDPFDRLLLAQATWEPMRLVSADAALARYGAIVIPI
jgi:PIN domain nuclease of toxin-antitoxin system